MCILISSTEHPDYPFILLSNRDEFFRRPTAPASFIDFEGGKEKILAPLDLARPEHGTWIGVTTKGKLAVLVNFREDDMSSSYSEISRGIIPLNYLKSKASTADEWVKNLENSITVPNGNGVAAASSQYPLRKIGGFSLLYGQLSVEPETARVNHLNILSNRGDRGKVHMPRDSDVPLLETDIEHKTTFGLSNSLYYDPWIKVKMGEELLSKAIKKSIVMRESFDDLVKSLFEVLSTDTFNKELADDDSIDFSVKSMELRKSIFLPPIDSGYNIPAGANPTVGKYYGTRTQTLVLLHKSGELHYLEKNLQNSDNLEDGDHQKVNHFHFNIQ